MKNSVMHIGRLAVAGILVMVAGSLNAAGTGSAQFLKLGAGARAAGMGDAFVAVANDVTGAYWNPAGLGQLQAPEVAFMHNNWLVDTQYQYAGGAMPMGRGVMGLSMQRMDYGTIDRYDAADAKNGSFDASSMAGNLTYGMELKEGLYLGGTLKFIQESIEAESASTFAGDLGVLYRTNDRYTWGASLSNVGPGLTMVQEEYDLPRMLRAGVSGLYLENRLLLSVGVTAPADNDPAINGGAEYRVNPMIALRGGYTATPGNSLDVGGLTGVTAGLGVALHNFSLDYAMVPFGDLGLTHRISLGFKFAAANR